MVDGRAARRGVVVGRGGPDQRPLGLLLGAVGVVVLDDVVLAAEEGDDGCQLQEEEFKRPETNSSSTPLIHVLL